MTIEQSDRKPRLRWLPRLAATNSLCLPLFFGHRLKTRWSIQRPRFPLCQMCTNLNVYTKILVYISVRESCCIYTNLSAYIRILLYIHESWWIYTNLDVCKRILMYIYEFWCHPSGFQFRKEVICKRGIKMHSNRGHKVNSLQETNTHWQTTCPNVLQSYFTHWLKVTTVRTLTRRSQIVCHSDYRLTDKVKLSLDSEDGFRKGFRNVSHKQQSFSGLQSPIRSFSIK